MYDASTRSDVCKVLRYSTHCQGITVLPAHLHFIRKRNELYLPLPSQPQLVLIYRPRRDGRLSRLWCEVAPAEIRTRHLPIANPALYQTATSALAKYRHRLMTIRDAFEHANLSKSQVVEQHFVFFQIAQMAVSYSAVALLGH